MIFSIKKFVSNQCSTNKKKISHIHVSVTIFILPVFTTLTFFVFKPPPRVVLIF